MLRPVSEHDHYSLNAVKLCHALVRFALESRMTEMHVNQLEADSLQTAQHQPVLNDLQWGCERTCITTTKRMTSSDELK